MVQVANADGAERLLAGASEDFGLYVAPRICGTSAPGYKLRLGVECDDVDAGNFDLSVEQLDAIRAKVESGELTVTEGALATAEVLNAPGGSSELLPEICAVMQGSEPQSVSAEASQYVDAASEICMGDISLVLVP